MENILFSITPDFTLFFELSIVIAIGVIIAIAMRLMRQPLIISYIITGLIVGPFVFNFIKSFETFNLFSEIGIAILLFTVGLNLTPNVIKQFGKVSAVAGIGQVIFAFSIIFSVCLMLGWTPIVAAYVAIALSFSSTIIILKLISDKKELESLYAKISVGFLLIQDIIALILLFSIPLLSTPDRSWLSILIMFCKGATLTFLVWLIAHKVLKPLNSFLSHSQELLFIFSVSWGFIIAALFKAAGFSLETGALVAGVALAVMPSRHEISARLVTLRDFFIVVFFIMLGAQMVLTGITAILPAAIILSLFVLIANPLILMTIMGIFGYRKRTSLKTALTVGQISEFSLILVALGVKLGHVDSKILSLVTLVALITIFFSTYMIQYSENIYKVLESFLSIFERKINREQKVIKYNYSVVLFGCSRIGSDFIEVFNKKKKKFLVVDYDPETVENLAASDMQVEYGDATDINFLESLNFKDLEIVISTIPTAESNVLILETVRRSNKKATIMMVSHSIKDALKLYSLGADYIILPHFLGGRYAADMLVKLDGQFGRRKFSGLKNRHLDYLQKKLNLGHEHPTNSN
ncbi:MAG: cation:proton antiporter [Candidatus Falkowbacteria bacterium]|nr:cation:proton antiporter [Candidatus Falkowbacteria bacterium]